MASMMYASLFIQVYDPSDHDLIDKIAFDLEEATGITYSKSYKDGESTESITKIINYIFEVTIAIMMFLCFFSLSASMSANLYD